MRSVILALVGALTLGVAACSSTQVDSTVTTLEATYLTLSAAETAYAIMPNANPAVVTQLKTLDSAAFAALQPLEALPAGASATAQETAAATAALDALTAYMTSQGISTTAPEAPAPVTAAKAA
jgi:hypothetical protein